MPSIAGIIADKWINAERLGDGQLLQIAGAIVLFNGTAGRQPNRNVLGHAAEHDLLHADHLAGDRGRLQMQLKNEGKDVVRDYPPIRVWGTIGFIVALWAVSLLHLETSAGQFYVASVASLVLGLYAFTLPPCPPKLGTVQERTLVDRLGLRCFALFKQRDMAVYLFFAMLLGAALQLTNAYGDTFLHDFANVDRYKDAFAVRYPAMIMSISQISETLFILAIPFFLKRFGIKTVMLISMLAWTLRFGLFAFGNPGSELWMIVLSCIVYGMAFDFFNISGFAVSVETQSDPKIRASAQGLFMVMTNGVGAVLGSSLSGFIIDRWFTYPDQSKNCARHLAGPLRCTHWRWRCCSCPCSSIGTMPSR